MIHKTPVFLERTMYQNPIDPLNGPAQYAYNTQLSTWDWLSENPLALDHFNTFMEGIRADAAHWADWFPVQKQLLDGAATDDRPLLVDIGGGRGHDLMAFKQKFPAAPGQFVLEDLPWVIDDIQSLDAGIKRVKHDFFTPQPIKGGSNGFITHFLSLAS